MKKTKLTFIILMIFYFISLWIYSPAFSSDKINWHKFKEGMDLGKKGRKKIFLYFYADCCRNCRGVWLCAAAGESGGA